MSPALAGFFTTEPSVHHGDQHVQPGPPPTHPHPIPGKSQGFSISQHITAQGPVSTQELLFTGQACNLIEPQFLYLYLEPIDSTAI